MYYDKLMPPCFSIPSGNSGGELDSDQWDYTRYRMLELLAYELRKIGLTGAVAEAGVFKGDFAWMLNRLFPQKKLYLFDTFSGFSNQEISDEINRGLVSEDFLTLLPEFEHTSVELVLNKMPFPDRCVICPGLFPASAQHLDETFCLVSIDMDFYQPTLDSLFYFYPKLDAHGYILLHDYNHDELEGPKQAIEEFRRRVPEVCVVPVADQCGTLILIKP